MQRPSGTDLQHKRIADLALRGRHAEALAASEEALRSHPGVPAFLMLRGAMLLELRRYDEAVQAIDRVLAAGHRVAPAYVIRGHALWRNGRRNDAVEALKTAVALNPTDYNTREVLGRFCLQLGDFERGWRECEHRLRYTKPILADTRRWNGEDIAGKHLLVGAEQGLGDTLQFVRYLPMLTALGARLTVVVQPALVALLHASDRSVEWTSPERVAGTFDFQFDLLSLPFVFGTRLETIPADGPYITADPERVRFWSSAIGTHAFKVGIGWQGSATGDPARNIPLSNFTALADLPGVRLISLQGANGVEQLSRLPPGMVEDLGERISRNPDGIAEIAAAMEVCDLLIVSDTMAAHLAGALARPVWVALPHEAEWRWLVERADSPWYPTMQLFRQKTQGDWPELFARLRVALATTAAA